MCISCLSVIKHLEQKQLTEEGLTRASGSRRGVCHREAWQQAAEAGAERAHPDGTQEAEEEVEVG